MVTWSNRVHLQSLLLQAKWQFRPVFDQRNDQLTDLALAKANNDEAQNGKSETEHDSTKVSSDGGSGLTLAFIVDRRRIVVKAMGKSSIGRAGSSAFSCAEHCDQARVKIASWQSRYFITQRLNDQCHIWKAYNL